MKMKNLARRAACAALALMAAGGAGAQNLPSVSLKALSATGDRALMIYNDIWADVELSARGQVRVLRPPTGCRWTSGGYSATGGLLGLTAFCAADQAAGETPCADDRAVMTLISEDTGRPRIVAEGRARRWTGLRWRAGAPGAMVIETRRLPHIPKGLNDLGRRRIACDQEPPSLALIDPQRGRRIGLDILPEGWRAVSTHFAAPDRVIADIRALAGDQNPAAREMALICKTPAAHPPWLAASCRGGALKLIWEDGEWDLLRRGGDPVQGRILFAANGAEARERCSIVRENGRARPSCAVEVTQADGATRVIEAPHGLFGDLRLSADGRILAAVAASRGRKPRRFDLFDLSSGARISLDELLNPAARFPTWRSP